MRRVFLVTIGFLFAVNASGQGVTTGFDLSNYGVRIEPDKRLIVVLSALEMATAKNAAGIDERLVNTPLSDKGLKFRERVIADNASLPEDLRRRISTFIAQYKKRNPKATDAEIAAPFVSMAYTLTPVPELSDPIITSDLPGSLLDVLDFAPLVREFYRKSSISLKLDEYVKDYQTDSDAVLRISAREMVSELLNYLHTRPRLTFTERTVVETTKAGSKTTLRKTESREVDRRFYIVPEKLVAKGDINFLNIRDDYYVVVQPDTDLSFSDARRAFLRFVLDPLVVANSNEVAAMRSWAKPLLDETRKADPSISSDVFLAITRSLVAATDVRQSEFAQLRIATEQSREMIDKQRTKEGKEKVSSDLKKFTEALSDEATLRLHEDYENGAVLSFYFAEQLKGIEDSGFDIAGSLREMIAAFDPVKASARLTTTAEARKRAMAARALRKSNPESRAVTVENPVTTRLLEIQKTIESKDLVKANVELKKLLVEYPSEPRIYYNIGRVASLSLESIDNEDAQAQKLLEAKAAYSNVISTATPTTDRALLSLTYVALARIYEFQSQKDYALKLYERAIEIGPVAAGGFQSAMDAKARLIKPQ
ncbi:MAG: tetratricopeptide repeat protein [Pyrinomonadaceae bacterium]